MQFWDVLDQYLQWGTLSSSILLLVYFGGIRFKTEHSCKMREV